MKGPIIVTGPDRSGTSLLSALLGTHPEISMTRRSNVFRWFHGRFGEPENLERCRQTMLRYQRLALLGPDEGRIRQEFWEGDPPHGRLIDLFHRHRAERLGRTRWGHKSLHTEPYGVARRPMRRLGYLPTREGRALLETREVPAARLSREKVA